MTTPKYYCPECFEYIGNSHRAACSRYPANQEKRPIYAGGSKEFLKMNNPYVHLSSVSHEWNEQAKIANNNGQMLLVHPKFLLDLLHSLDAARKENEDLKDRFEEAVKKLKG